MKKFKAEPEDLPIYFKGHHIGHFIAKIPWLHLQAWTYLGQLPDLKNRSPKKPIPIEKRKVQNPINWDLFNNKV